MSNQWHYSQDGAQYGPVDEAEIVQLIQDGELAPGTPVCKEGSKDWGPARNHACFQVEIYPKKKRPSVQASTPTASKPAPESIGIPPPPPMSGSPPSSGGRSQTPNRRIILPVTASSSPAVTTVVVKEKSALPWVVFGVSVLVLVGVLLFMDRPPDESPSDEPQLPLVATGITNTSAGPQPVTNRPPATTGPTIPQPPAPDPQLARTYYGRGRNFDLGRGGESKDYTEAAKWYRKAADMGHAGAQYNLGSMYANGEGVLEDDKEALKWYRKAALQGDAMAQYNLGNMYHNGEGVLEDDKEAVEWFRKSALQGYAGAQHNLGVMYRDGKGVLEDGREAVKWFRKAALQGNALAQSAFGEMCRDGKGVLEDDKEAVEWFRKSAMQGNSHGQFNLGVMYFNGEGVLRDYVTAYAWYNIAAANGNTEAATWKDNAAKRLTSAQIIQAQALSRTLSSQIRTP